jgi:hypothetical protein
MGIGPQDVFLLDQWGRQLHEAFGEMPYLVGSVARGERQWRDVDVRLPIEDEDWPHYSDPPAKLYSLNLAVTLWGRHVTGLPIDFQFQSLTEYRAETGIVNPLGIRSRVGWVGV